MSKLQRELEKFQRDKEKVFEQAAAQKAKTILKKESRLTQPTEVKPVAQARKALIFLLRIFSLDEFFSISAKRRETARARREDFRSSSDELLTLCSARRGR